MVNASKLAVNFLHISDIHVNGERHFSLPRFGKVAEALGACQQDEPLIIVISGDIAYSGTQKEYSLLEPILKKMEQDIEDFSGVIPQWIIVPGNHDADFKGVQKSRDFVISGILREGEEGIDDTAVSICTGPQKSYFEFREKFGFAGNVIYRDELLVVHELEYFGKKIHVWAMNVSWMSQLREQQGNLVFPVRRYQDLIHGEAHFRIAVLHHPLNWYSQGAYHSLQDLLLKNFCVVFSGHEHVSNGHVISQFSSAGGTVMHAAGAFGPHSEKERSEFSFLKLDLNTSSLEQHHFLWNERYSCFQEDVSRRLDSAVTLRTQRQFEINDSMKERLEELGAPFSHPIVERLRLSDIYIEPLLRQEFSDIDDDSSVAGFSILNEDAIGRIIVHGDDHAGKSSYLYRIYLKASEMGYVPVLVTLKDISNGSDEERDKKIDDLVRSQYSSSAVDAYSRLPLERRLILLDDLDHLSSNEDAYIRVLKYLSRHSKNCIVTVNERFDVSVLGSREVSGLFSDYQRLNFLGFSYVMRTQLIERWYGLDRAIDRSAFERKVHDAQTYLDAAIGKASVPSTPFNTLLILQALETTQKTQVVDAGIAQHYDLLLKRRLLDSGVSQKLHDGIYAYLAHLAWWMRENGASMIDYSDLERFNKNFSRLVNPVNLQTQLDLLTKSRILSFVEGSYKFKYPSSRYFFLAHYVSENVEEDVGLRGFVEHACRHLYQRDNANLIVFLTSKVASKWIVREVANVLATLLKELLPLNVISDARQLNEWVSTTARIAMDDELDHQTNRHEQRRREEAAARREAKERDAEEVEDVTKLDVFAQMNLVFKTGEILGMILKSRYGSLDIGLKQNILKELFEGPLRAISLFLDVVNDHPDALIDLLTKHLDAKVPHFKKYEDAQKQKLIKRFIFSSIGQYSLALISRQGAIVGSPELVHSFNNMNESILEDERAKRKPLGSSSTYRLVTVSAKLSYPGDIPVSEIDRLARDYKYNPFAFSLLQGLVAQHLYMFPVRYDVKQSLAKMVGIDLRKQITSDAIKGDEKITGVRKYEHRNSKSLIQQLSQSYLATNEEAMKLVLTRRKKKESGED